MEDFRCGPSYPMGCYTQEEYEEKLKNSLEHMVRNMEKSFPVLVSIRVAEFYAKLEPYGA
jgi:hypothetical protein